MIIEIYSIGEIKMARNNNDSFIDLTFLSSVFVCFILIFFIFKNKFVSIFLFFPLLLLVCFLYKYVEYRDSYQAWYSIKTGFIVSVILFIIFSFVSKYSLDTIEFLAGSYGYIKTVVFHISDYEKIDFSGNYTDIRGKNTKEKNRNLYIVGNTNRNMILEYVDKIVGFKGDPKLESEYSDYYVAESYKYGHIRIRIDFRNNYSLVGIYT